MKKFGEHLVLIDRRPISISADHFWSVFDDFLTLQQSLHTHGDDTRLEPGPKNGPGATISFEFEGARTYETLLVKDDKKKIWKIELPRANAVFSFYEATVTVHPGCEGAPDEVEAKVDGVLLEKDDKARLGVIDYIVGIWNTRIRELVEVVINRDGLKQSHEFVIKCPLHHFWKSIENWGDVSWVVGSVDVVVYGTTPPTRTIKFENGQQVFVYQRMISAEDHRMIYVIEQSTERIAFQAYMGTIQLSTIPDESGSVKVNYDLAFIAKPGFDPENTNEAVKKDMNNRWAVLKERFAKPSL